MTKADVLLNFSMEDSKSHHQDSNPFKSKLSPELNLLESDFQSKLTTDDLLGLGDNSSETVDVKILSSSANNARVDNNLFEVSEGNVQNQSSNKSTSNLLRNTSTPNLANFDPFEDPFGAFLSFPNSDANKAGASIPRVSSYTTFSNENKNSSVNNVNANRTAAQSNKPNYSRSNFGDIPSTTGVKTPRMQGNEFEDLLGGFIKTPLDANPKSIAQLRKEELVIMKDLTMFD